MRISAGVTHVNVTRFGLIGMFDFTSTDFTKAYIVFIDSPASSAHFAQNLIKAILCLLLLLPPNDNNKVFLWKKYNLS